ncbi:MAG: ATP-binding protein [Methylococcales bacterium]|nr:ATP-binding protein [Methylococcales bacterium]MDD5755257.1 ATP-binding protein [Methylococcales bacterium]
MDKNTAPRQRHPVTKFCLRLLASIAIVVVAAALRIWPLEGLELRLAYLTFYPAVMFIAVYNGVWFGVLTAAFSALTIFYWSPTDKPFIVDSGDWLGMAVFLANCTMISLVAEGMIRARKRARIAQRQAESANKAKSVFLATMSHELRTPLNAILGFSNLMRNDPNITPPQRENLDIINRSGEHLLTLINDVLDMSKIEAGRVVLENKPFDISILVHNITDMFEVRANEKGLQLLLDQSSQLPHFVISDPDKLRQIITNLVGNAIKYTFEGGVVLRLNVQTKGVILYLIIEVEDSGIGISKEDQQHVFEPFVQVGNATIQKGTGLGLAIVREYVTLMGGNITVESEFHKGSIFRATIPVQSTEMVPEILLQDSTEREVMGLEAGQGDYRILIVEDQLENQLLLQKLLKDAGFIVAIAENGEDGVKRFQSFHPHFIWMDRRMPVMDGLEATQRIRALPGGNEVKIAAVTASAFSDQRDEMLAAGMDDFVRKPYHPTEIFDCMARLLGIHFTYKPLEPSNGDTYAITKEVIASLPKSLRHEMINSLILGDSKKLTELLQQIRQQDVNLAKMITQQVDSFNYLPILNILESIDKDNSTLEENL